MKKLNDWDYEYKYWFRRDNFLKFLLFLFSIFSSILITLPTVVKNVDFYSKLLSLNNDIISQNQHTSQKNFQSPNKSQKIVKHLNYYQNFSFLKLLLTIFLVLMPGCYSIVDMLFFNSKFPQQKTLYKYIQIQYGNDLNSLSNDLKNKFNLKGNCRAILFLPYRVGFLQWAFGVFSTSFTITNNPILQVCLSLKEDGFVSYCIGGSEYKKRKLTIKPERMYAFINRETRFKPKDYNDIKYPDQAGWWSCRPLIFFQQGGFIKLLAFSSSLT